MRSVIWNDFPSVVESCWPLNEKRRVQVASVGRACVKMQLKRAIFMFTGFAGLMTLYSILYSSQPVNLNKLEIRRKSANIQNGKQIDSPVFTLLPHPKVIDEYFTSRKVCFYKQQHFGCQILKPGKGLIF